MEVMNVPTIIIATFPYFICDKILHRIDRLVKTIVQSDYLNIQVVIIAYGSVGQRPNFNIRIHIVFSLFFN